VCSSNFCLDWTLSEKLFRRFVQLSYQIPVLSVLYHGNLSALDLIWPWSSFTSAGEFGLSL